jgi:hypothetical protein
MAINFPNSPILNQTYSSGNTTYTWNGTSWTTYTSYTSTVGSSSQYTNQYTLTGYTTSNTETEIFINGVANSRISVTSNTGNHYTVDFTAKSNTFGDFAAFQIKGVVANSSGTVADKGSLYENIVVRTDSTWLVDTRADNTNKSLNIYVQGANSKNVSWKAIVTTMEV